MYCGFKGYYKKYVSDDALDQLLSDRRDEGNSEAVREPIKEAKDRYFLLWLFVLLKESSGQRYYIGI